MPTKGNVRRITSKTPYEIIQKGCIKEKYERAKKAEDFASGSARNSASLSFSVQPFSLCYGVCLSGGAKRAALVYAKHTPQYQLLIYKIHLFL